MSTQPQALPKTRLAGDRRSIRIIQHSQLFYWWPVWALGLLLGLVTWAAGPRMVLVPTGTKIHTAEDRSNVYHLEMPQGKDETRNVSEAIARQKLNREPFPIHILDFRWVGVFFFAVLLLVIFSTNVPLRGLWSFILLIVLIMLSIIISLIPGAWDTIVDTFDLLDIRMNAAGYVVFSLALLAMWLMTVFLFDRQIYILFTPGQMRVRTEIGGGEEVFDTMGMVLQKQRDDLFRHWVLGFGGAGDLIVKTAGAHPREFHLSNVLFISHKLQKIEEMLRDRPVVAGE
jgi:hypothetical protein